MLLFFHILVDMKAIKPDYWRSIVCTRLIEYITSYESSQFWLGLDTELSQIVERFRIWCFYFFSIACVLFHGLSDILGKPHSAGHIQAAEHDAEESAQEA